jgi:Tfp pilus assembly protein PilF
VSVPVSDDSPSPRSAALASFERMLASGKDGAMLRYSLGNEYMKASDVDRALVHLERAVQLDARYTAAWKLYGKALQQAGREDDALAAYRSGIEVAREKGDRQAEKEMAVFAKRIENARAGGS